MILEILNPEYRFSSLVKISPAWMHNRNFRILLIDIDNTLLPRSSCIVPAQHMEWLLKMQQQGVSIVLFSNNGGKRVLENEKQLINKGVRVPVLKWAGKPFPWAYTAAIRLLEKCFPKEGLHMTKHPSGILAVGDQLFTDVLGAHWYNLPVAWLCPLSQNDFIGTKILRVLEAGVTWYLAKRGVLSEEDKE